LSGDAEFDASSQSGEFMNYQINRGGQSYGPYTLADLQRYVTSGHILLTDQVKSEEMPDWVPVSQVLNPAGPPPAFDAAPPIPAAAYAGGYATPGAPMGAFDDPPNLNWGLVLLFDALTCGLFQMVWNLIFSAWMKRVQPNSKALFFYIGGYVLGLLYSIGYFPMMMEQVRHVMAHDMAFQPHAAHRAAMYLVAFAGWVLKLVARFNMKSSLEEHYNTVEPLGVRLNGFAVFFFGGLYIQSKLNRINEMKQVLRYREFGR